MCETGRDAGGQKIEIGSEVYTAWIGDGLNFVVLGPYIVDKVVSFPARPSSFNYDLRDSKTGLIVAEGFPREFMGSQREAQDLCVKLNTRRFSARTISADEYMVFEPKKIGWNPFWRCTRCGFIEVYYNPNDPSRLRQLVVEDKKPQPHICPEDGLKQQNLRRRR